MVHPQVVQEHGGWDLSISFITAVYKFEELTRLDAFIRQRQPMQLSRTVYSGHYSYSSEAGLVLRQEYPLVILFPPH